jgi:hypothetical protein
LKREVEIRDLYIENYLFFLDLRMVVALFDVMVARNDRVYADINPKDCSEV